MKRLPHPIPYQGSKRNLASAILAVVLSQHFRRMYEPFVGSAAITIAAAQRGLADEFVVGDSLEPLIDLWRMILADPACLADQYESVWNGQLEGGADYYDKIRATFNESRNPVHLLYLLARCVKNSPRFNQQGDFNQSRDKRRQGMWPDKMRKELAGAAHLLAGKTEAVAGDFEAIIKAAGPPDLVYMDPPWEGTSKGRDKRYHNGLDRDRLIAALAGLNSRGVPYLLSYDGQCGEKKYGEPLPASLALHKIDLHAGRSSQATLHGRDDVTIESLYVSPALWERKSSVAVARVKPEQFTLSL